MERKIIDLEDQNDTIFLEPIPKWITQGGFYLIIFIFIFLILASLFIEYPNSVVTKVYITNDSAYTKVPFNTFESLKDVETIEIINPFNSNKINGLINKGEAWAESDSIFLPVNIERRNINMLRFEDKIICTGKISSDKKNILSTIISD